MAGDSRYTSRFYTELADGCTRSAGVVVPLLLSVLPVKSVVDVGCGLGAWAKAFLNHGVPEVLGVDGDYVDRSQLQIPPESFLVHDLMKPLDLGRTFDLAVCLEVVEHLPPSRAEGLVSDLVSLAPCILFSAAVPGQGGTHHVNEQYLSYWVKLFQKQGYKGVDAIRPRILGNNSVDLWYQQNVAIFAAPCHPVLSKGFPHPADIIHPLLYADYLHRPPWPPNLGMLVRALPGAVFRSVRFRLHRTGRDKT